MALPPNVQKLFTDRNFGVVTTVRADGTPHSTPVWIDAEGGRVGFNTAIGRAKERHLRRNPWVSVTVLPSEDLQSGYAVVYGKAVQFDDSDAADKHIDKLAKKYIDQDSYPWRSPEEKRVIVWIEPERIEGYGAGSTD